MFCRLQSNWSLTEKVERKKLDVHVISLNTRKTCNLHLFHIHLDCQKNLHIEWKTLSLTKIHQECLKLSQTSKNPFMRPISFSHLEEVSIDNINFLKKLKARISNMVLLLRKTKKMLKILWLIMSLKRSLQKSINLPSSLLLVLMWASKSTADTILKLSNQTEDLVFLMLRNLMRWNSLSIILVHRKIKGYQR